VGAVVGATLEIEEVRKLRELMPQAMMPGLGAQGSTIDTVRACFDKERKGVIVPISRSITYPSSAFVKEKGYGVAVRDNVL
jgi:orotidine-5'-phosphate decarboxylase